MRLLDDYRSVREDSGELDEGRAGRSYDPGLHTYPGGGAGSTRSPALCHPLMVETMHSVRILGSVLCYLMHSCTKGLCANPTDLFFQNPSLHSIQSLSFFLIIFDLALILIVLLTPV
jgi:hypothetical protein